VEPSGRREYGALAGILVVALALRLAVVLLVHNVQYSDSVWYDAAAARLAAIGEYGPKSPSAWFPPGYPFFLASVYKVFGHAPMAGKIANVLLGTGTCAIAYALARTMFGWRVGLVAAALVAVWPNLIFHTLILDSETLAATLFMTALWLGAISASRRSGWPLAPVLGLVLGWAMLTRPAGAILAVAIGLGWWMSYKSFSRAARAMIVPAAVAALMVLTWSARNRIRFGEWILVATNGGYNFWQANNRYADGTDSFWSRVPAGDSEFVIMRTGDEFVRNRQGYRYAKAFLSDHPMHPLLMAPVKIREIYHTDTSGLYEGILNGTPAGGPGVAGWMVAHQRLVESLTYRFYFTVGLFAIVACVLTPPAGRTSVYPLAALPILLVAFHLFFHAKDRFHVPLNPVFAVLAASLVIRLPRRHG
jgi:4-amino-4-deoxy-L-arabinose transferase-like glycosyltransferase